MIKNTTVRFELFSPRINKDGKAPIRIIYQFAGERKFIPTKLKIRPINWDSKERKAIYVDKEKAKSELPEIKFPLFPTSRDITDFNNELAAISARIRAIENNFELNNRDYKLQEIIDIYTQKENDGAKAIKSEPKVYISDFIDCFIELNQNIIKSRTLATYSTLSKHLQKFGKKRDRLTFETLTYERLKELHQYFIRKGMNNTTISKQFSILKGLMKQAIRQYRGSINICQDFRDYNITRKDNDYEVIVLDQSEFDSILDFDLSDSSKRVSFIRTINGKEILFNVSYKSLDKVRDLFVFACTTGLRYSDISDLRAEHLRDNIIYKKAIKTGQQLEIPLNAISAYILNKYSGQAQLLPVISNQKCNDYLKVLGRIAGIDSIIEKTREYGTKTISKSYKKYELMSMHMGRRVFATLTLEKGVPSQDVMSLTGHKKYASFKRYMHISSAQKRKAMSVWGEIDQVKKLQIV